jgi:hypothetical protein
MGESLSMLPKEVPGSKKMYSVTKCNGDDDTLAKRQPAEKMNCGSIQAEMQYFDFGCTAVFVLREIRATTVIHFHISS